MNFDITLPPLSTGGLKKAAQQELSALTRRTRLAVLISVLSFGLLITDIIACIVLSSDIGLLDIGFSFIGWTSAMIAIYFLFQKRSFNPISEKDCLRVLEIIDRYPVAKKYVRSLPSRKLIGYELKMLESYAEDQELIEKQFDAHKACEKIYAGEF